MWSQWTRVAALLVSACASAGAQFSMFSNSYGMSMSMDSQSSCFSTQNGFTTANAHPYTYYLEPMRSDFDFQIPEYQGCNKVGVSVSSCERGGASTDARLAGTARLLVRRSGDLSAPARLDTVVYCA